MRRVYIVKTRKKKNITSKAVIPTKMLEPDSSSSNEESVPTKKYYPIILEDDTSSD